jgi:hypothetical protein
MSAENDPTSSPSTSSGRSRTDAGAFLRREGTRGLAYGWFEGSRFCEELRFKEPAPTRGSEDALGLVKTAEWCSLPARLFTPTGLLTLVAGDIKSTLSLPAGSPESDCRSTSPSEPSSSSSEFEPRDPSRSSDSCLIVRRSTLTRCDASKATRCFSFSLRAFS